MLRVVEACLAHAVGDAAELAYKRSDFLEKRREVMSAWSAWSALPMNLRVYDRKQIPGLLPRP
jgi:hypothetical protein